MLCSPLPDLRPLVEIYGGAAEITRGRTLEGLKLRQDAANHGDAGSELRRIDVSEQSRSQPVREIADLLEPGRRPFTPRNGFRTPIQFRGAAHDEPLLFQPIQHPRKRRPFDPHTLSELTLGRLALR